MTNAEEKMVGSQISLLLNRSKKEFSGLQLSAVGNLANKMDGVQVSTTFNVAQQFDGIQVGALNAANTVNTQIGTLNGANNTFLQISTMNIAKNVEIQIATVNWAQTLSTLQVGVINYAKRDNGRSIGIINICPYCEKTPIGLISFVGNGVWNFSTLIDETGSFLGNLRLGTASFYTTFEASRPFNFDDGKFDKV